MQPYGAPVHRAGPPGFNPLRGRQTLQPERWRGETPTRMSFNPLRGRQTLQPGGRAWCGFPWTRFQSSTRQTDFATHVGCSRRTMLPQFQSSTRQTDFATWRGPPGPPRPGGFNPLRGRQTLQPTHGRLVSLAMAVFQSSTRQTDFATTATIYVGGTAIGFQSSTRQTDFATSAGVSCARSLWTMFQSSTRQTDFATAEPVWPPGPGHSFNPLRGRQTLQRGTGGGLPPAESFQSSTRQTDFATHPRRARGDVLRRVSILYEADRLCNSWACPSPWSGPTFQSSTRQTDFATLWGPPQGFAPWVCFNPLRGRQTLQLPLSGSGSR